MYQANFQVMSDLHLETPQARPTYEEFHIEPKCEYLALLGDIGNIWNPRLFAFLEEQLRQFKIVFFLLGNHEAHGTSMPAARRAAHEFEKKLEELHSLPGSTIGRFVFLNQTRYDLTENITVLGCTLFSRISHEQRESVALFCSDFSEIEDWTIESHNAAHQSDVTWLNSQVEHIARQEPHRNVVIFTHYSPTVLEAANDIRHSQDTAQVRSAFVTDLSDQVCWSSMNVRLWGFGHTHFNCDFEDSVTKRRVIANQKGYRRAEVETFDAVKVVRVDAHLVQRKQQKRNFWKFFSLKH